MKKFNPNAGPYKQLLEHDGPAIIYVQGPNFYEDRVRATFKATDPEYTSLGDYKKVFSKWRASSSGNDDVSRKSCFNRSSYRKTIEAMKEYDKKSGLKIVHIEFY
jgi:hypothetical protein